jgi:hypothetical protein
MIVPQFLIELCTFNHRQIVCSLSLKSHSQGSPPHLGRILGHPRLATGYQLCGFRLREFLPVHKTSKQIAWETHK